MADEKKKKKTPVVDTPETTKEEEVKEDTTFSQEDVDKIISERLSREREKIQEETKKAITEARKEAEELAKMTSEEKEKELTRKYKEELAEKEKTLATRENRLEAIDMFTEANIPIHLVDYVVETDKQKTIEKAEQFVSSYQESVENTVTEKLKGKAPKDVNKNSKTPKSKKVVTSF